MHLLALLAACGLAQAAPAAALPPLVPPHCSSTSAFVGFSTNAQAAAERVAVSCPRGRRGRDVLSYLRVYQVATGELVGVFRGEVPTRTEGGREVAVAPATWNATYEAYRRALRPAAWRRLAQRADFASKPYDFGQDVVRLAPIAGGLCHAHAAKQVVAVESCGDAGLGFGVVVRTLGGSNEEAVIVASSARRGHLRLHFSRDARHFAALLATAGKPAALVLGAHPLSDPIDLNDQLGAVPMMRWDAQQAYDDLADLLPPSDDRARELAEDAFRM